MFISFISCQLVCVLMRLKDFVTLPLKLALGFACNILICIVRTCASKKKGIENEALQ